MCDRMDGAIGVGTLNCVNIKQEVRAGGIGAERRFDCDFAFNCDLFADGS